MRVRIAASAMPSVAAGSTIYPQVDGWPHEAVPETGKRPRLIAKNKIRIGPNAKLGKLSPSKLTKLSKRSSHWLRRRADRTPAGIEISRAIVSAEKVSNKVEG